MAPFPPGPCGAPHAGPRGGPHERVGQAVPQSAEGAPPRGVGPGGPGLLLVLPKRRVLIAGEGAAWFAAVHPHGGEWVPGGGDGACLLGTEGGGQGEGGSQGAGLGGGLPHRGLGAHGLPLGAQLRHSRGHAVLGEPQAEGLLGVLGAGGVVGGEGVVVGAQRGAPLGGEGPRLAAEGGGVEEGGGLEGGVVGGIGGLVVWGGGGNYGGENGGLGGGGGVGVGGCGGVEGGVVGGEVEGGAGGSREGDRRDLLLLGCFQDAERPQGRKIGIGQMLGSFVEVRFGAANGHHS